MTSTDEGALAILAPIKMYWQSVAVMGAPLTTHAPILNKSNESWWEIGLNKI